MKTAVIYIRVRTNINEQEQINFQKTLCQQLANDKDLTIVGYYLDNEKFGNPINRNALSQMIHDSLTASWDYVITYSADRVCRKMGKLLKIISTLKKRNKKLLIYTSPDHDLYTELIQEFYKCLPQRRKKWYENISNLRSLFER